MATFVAAVACPAPLGRRRDATPDLALSLNFYQYTEVGAKAAGEFCSHAAASYVLGGAPPCRPRYGHGRDFERKPVG